MSTKKKILILILNIILGLTIFQFGCSFSKYNVNLSSNTTEGIVKGGGAFQSGKKIKIEATISDDSIYEWLGWYQGNQLYTKEQTFTYTVQSKNVTFTAKWSGMHVNVVCYSDLNNNYSHITNDNIILSYTNNIEGMNGIEYGTIPTLYDEKMEIPGYSFEGWYTEPEFENKLSDGDGKFYEEFLFKTPVTLYAKWSVQSRKLNLESNSNLTEFKTYLWDEETTKYLSTENDSFSYNSKIKVEITNKGELDGQNTFYGWDIKTDNVQVTYEDEQKILIFIMPNNDVTFEALYNLDESGFEYDTSGTTNVLVQYYGNDDVCMIPFEYNGKKTDTIGDRAFKKSTCNSLIISNNIKYIEKETFYDVNFGIYFDIGSDFSLINQSCFQRENFVYLNIEDGYDIYYANSTTYNSIKVLCDGLCGVRNGKVADTRINSLEEYELLMEYVYLHSIDKLITINFYMQITNEDVKEKLESNTKYQQKYYSGIEITGLGDSSGGGRTIKYQKNLEKYELASKKSEDEYLYEVENNIIMEDPGVFKENFNTGDLSLSNKNEENRVLAIENLNIYTVCNTSEELLDAVEHGARPVFIEENCRAKQVYDKAKYILKTYLDSTMTDYQKTLAIHDYIISRTSFDRYKSQLANKKLVLRTEYLEGVILDGVSNINGYMKAMSLLLSMEGVTNIRYLGVSRTAPSVELLANAETRSDIWNKVKISTGDGEEARWYNIDFRVDEIYNVEYNNVEIPEMMTHKGFLVSDLDMDTESGTGNTSKIKRYYTLDEEYVSEISWRREYFCSVTFGGVSLYFEELDTHESYMRIYHDLSDEVVSYFTKNPDKQFLQVEVALSGVYTSESLSQFQTWFDAEDMYKISSSFDQNGDGEYMTIIVVIYVQKD